VRPASGWELAGRDWLLDPNSDGEEFVRG